MMGNEHDGASRSDGGMQNLEGSGCSVSRAGFSLKRVQNNADACFGNISESSKVDQTSKDADGTSGDEVNFVRALRRRPWINYGKFDSSSDDESDNGKYSKAYPSKTSLPKGVIRGCSNCDSCQKVVARWRPEEACRPMLEEAPVFYPTEKEFEDTLGYISIIREKAEPYGICRIVPPPLWKPSCPLKESSKWQTAKFPTRVQRIDKLQVREPMNKKRRSTVHRRKRRRHGRKGRPRSHHYTSENDSECFASDEDEKFGFDSGSEFTLERFEKYADDFKDQYFGVCEMKNKSGNGKVEPSVENIEGEYWRMVEKPTEEIEVIYGQDVETGIFGSGFPKYFPGTDFKNADPYALSGWNLNNFPRLPQSVLSFEATDISGVLVPWIYLGMCFSSFCWHVEDHHFYSLNYMHFGSPKVWYGVPGSAAVQFEQAMRKHLPELFEEQPDLLHKLVTQLSPSVLKSEGVPVYRTVQRSGEFVLTFPRAYHAGFNAGFNCAEAVNVAPMDWFPHGQMAVELYKEQCRKTSVSHDKLLLGASREAVKHLRDICIFNECNSTKLNWQKFCGKDGILTKSLKERVDMERFRRNFLAKDLKSRKMDENFDAATERECFLCFYDLHFSAVGCECSPERFSCLTHASQLCSCPWPKKYLLYRHDIPQLELLTLALEGNKDALSSWSMGDHGQTLNPQGRNGSQFLDMESQTKKSDFHKTSFTTMLNMACGAKGQDMVSTNFNLVDNKPTVSEVALNCSKTETMIQPIENNSLTKSIGTTWKMPAEKRTVLDINEPYAIEHDETDDQSKAEMNYMMDVDSDPKSISHEGDTIQNGSLNLGGNETVFNERSFRPYSGTIEGSTQKSLAGKTNMKRQARASTNANFIVLSDDEGNSGKQNVMTEGAKDFLNNVNSNGKHIVQTQQNLISLTSIDQRGHCRGLDAMKTNKHIMNDASTSHFGLTSINDIQESDSNHQAGFRKPNIVQELLPRDNIKVVKESVRARLTEKYLSNSSTASEQRGPRLAKVIRVPQRPFEVELLDVGILRPQKSWYSSQTILTKGFKSRVKFYSLLDPTKLCNYISTVVDHPPLGPVFKVFVEDQPTFAYSSSSADGCWKLVQEKLNKEIMKFREAGIQNLPAVQALGSLNGLEMFGFTAPSIIQAIEQLDQDHQCLEYWASRTGARNLQITPPGKLHQNLDLGMKIKIDNQATNCIDMNVDHPVVADNFQSQELEDQGPNSSSDRIYVVLQGLLQKATADELWALHKVFCGEAWNPNWKALYKALLDELKKTMSNNVFGLWNFLKP